MSAQYERVELSTTIDLDGYDDVEVQVTGIFLPGSWGIRSSLGLPLEPDDEPTMEIETVAVVSDVTRYDDDNNPAGFQWKAGETLNLDREQEEALIAKLLEARNS